jgi:DNA-binding GntR family transcriptional regulator
LSGLTFRLRRRAAEPAWAQIEAQLAERIESGGLAAGERLPPERALAATLGVSRMTVRQALDALARRGLLERGVGRGTFVSGARLEITLDRALGFTERLAGQGLQAEARVLLACAEGEELHVRRLRLTGGRPLALEDSWLPAAPFPGLLERDLSGSLYALMRDAYGREPVRAVERLVPVAAGEPEASALQVRPGAPLMLVERTAYAADGALVERARDHHRGDRSAFVVHLERR